MNSNVNSIPTTRPEHHLHKDSERLPGAKGAAPTVDYSASTMNHTPSSAWDGELVGNTPGRTTRSSRPRSSSLKGEAASKTQHPFEAKPPPVGGVAVGDQTETPESRVGMGDKIIGKTQKVIGKYTHNMELHEKGGLREAGGKAATLGETRATHD